MMAEAPSSSALSCAGGASAAGGGGRSPSQHRAGGVAARAKARAQRLVQHQVAARELLEQRLGDALGGEPGLQLAPAAGPIDGRLQRRERVVEVEHPERVAGDDAAARCGVAVGRGGCFSGVAPRCVAHDAAASQAQRASPPWRWKRARPAGIAVELDQRGLRLLAGQAGQQPEGLGHSDHRDRAGVTGALARRTQQVRLGA